MDVRRAAVYARFSSEEQTGGESIEYQLERCREHIIQQSWLLDESNVYVDRARSGTTTYRREEFSINALERLNSRFIYSMLQSVMPPLYRNVVALCNRQPTCVVS